MNAKRSEGWGSFYGHTTGQKIFENELKDGRYDDVTLLVESETGITARIAKALKKCCGTVGTVSILLDGPPGAAEEIASAMENCRRRANANGRVMEYSVCWIERNGQPG